MSSGAGSLGAGVLGLRGAFGAEAVKEGGGGLVGWVLGNQLTVKSGPEESPIKGGQLSTQRLEVGSLSIDLSIHRTQHLQDFLLLLKRWHG